MQKIAETIHGYTYGTAEVSTSPVSLQQLAELKVSVGFTDDDERHLQQAGQILSTQTKEIIEHWRNKIIAGIPNLAKHSQALDGAAIPKYSAQSGLRFQQWILDTCLRPYDQDWLNYQHEIALRHTSLKKNRTDGVDSTPYVPLRHIVGFIAVINETIKPYLAAQGHATEQVDAMHRAWCKSMQLQLALWTKPYSDVDAASNEW